MEIMTSEWSRHQPGPYRGLSLAGLALTHEGWGYEVLNGRATDTKASSDNY